MEKAYGIFHKVLEYAGNKPLFFIGDISDLLLIPRSARKVMEEHENHFKAYWKHVYHILPPFGRALLSFYRTFQPQRVEGHTLVSDFHQALGMCLNYEKPLVVWDLGSRHLLAQSLKKASRQELENMVLELSGQKEEMAKQRDARILELFRIIGKITWDKNFTPEKLETPPNDPFQELFIATSLLQQDVFEMMEELKELNHELENKVDVRTLALKEKETNLRNILDNNDKIIVLLNPQLEVKDFNKRYADLYFAKTGQQPSYNSPFPETFFHGEEERRTWKARLEKTLQSGNPGEYLEGRIENGVESFFETKVFPILEGNTPIGITFFSIDITDKVQFERRLKLQNEELIKVNHELDKFVYSISHDLRAPLTSAMALINLARAEPNPEMFQTYLNLQEKSLKKLDAFIMDVLNLSKNSRLELEKEPIDLKDMVQDIYQEYLFDEEGKRVEKRMEINLEGPVVSDKTRVRILLHNLINNAIRYSRPQEGVCYVEVSAKHYPGNMIQLMVKDNGTGIDPAHINHIFNMFYRATSQKHGSGLGLYIVREITNKMGGIVRVKSEPNHGSTFEVLIPNMVATTLSKVNQ
jgi:PAS domain S-box-containing protein